MCCANAHENLFAGKKVFKYIYARIWLPVRGSILSEDLLLTKKALRLAIPVYNVSRLIVLYYQDSRLDQSGCLMHLRTLADKKIIPKTTYRELAESIKL
jgi:hypothetical protein